MRAIVGRFYLQALVSTDIGRFHQFIMLLERRPCKHICTTPTGPQDIYRDKSNIATKPGLDADAITFLCCAYKCVMACIPSNSPAGRVVRSLSYRNLGEEPAETGVNDSANGMLKSNDACAYLIVGPVFREHGKACEKQGSWNTR